MTTTHGPRTVLLVDDDVSVRNFICTYLESRGVFTIVAASGQEAMQVLECHRDTIRLVLTDLNMPGLSGVDVARQVRRSYPETPVVFMTGYWDRSLDEFGDVRVLPKPLDLGELLAVLSDACPRAASLSAGR